MTIKVRLEWTTIAEHRRDYHLFVRDDDGAEKRIEVARIDHGGMRLVGYEASWRGDDRILSAFFCISILGHELDQWLHFDLRTGRQVMGYVNPMQAAGRDPQKEHVETQDDKKIVAEKLRSFIDRWGHEKDGSSGRDDK
jgi:hypothetical protein